MPNTFRAAIWTSADRQGQLVLTGPGQAHLSDDELLRKAEQEFVHSGLQREDGDSLAIGRSGDGRQEIDIGARIRVASNKIRTEHGYRHVTLGCVGEVVDHDKDHALAWAVRLDGEASTYWFATEELEVVL